MDKMPEPYPCWKSTSTCPYSLRCREIDEAAGLVADPEVFAQLAVAYEQLTECHDPEVGFVFFQKPTARQKSEGICPAYAGHWNGGPRSSVACSLTELQLHDYCELKFCEKGRNVYCPIWKAKGGAEDGE